jgi:hypothetical protein
MRSAAAAILFAFVQGVAFVRLLRITQRTLQMDVGASESHDDILLRSKRRQRHATLSVTQYRRLWGT